MFWNCTIFFIFIVTILTVFATEDLYEQKCKRNCDTVLGSLNCWKETTDGFAYGLATSMVDFCQVILKIRDISSDKESWYNITRDIISKQIQEYDLETDVKQLTKDNIEQIVVTLLNKCFNASSSVTSVQPSCPSCSEVQTVLIKQWRISSIILISIGAVLVFIIILIYSLYTYRVRRMYILI